MSRIKLPAVEEMVVFGRLLNRGGGCSTLWAEQQPRCSALAGTLGPFFLLSLMKRQAGKRAHPSSLEILIIHFQRPVHRTYFIQSQSALRSSAM